VYDFKLTRKFETGSVSLIAAQTVSPRSTGVDNETTRVSLQGRRSFSAKLSGALAVSYIRATRVTDVQTQQAGSTDRYRIAPSLSWQLDRDLVLGAGYTYTSIDRGTATDAEADSNVAFVSLGYTWPRMAVSR
jgi:long-subunit fatty acid transport protein